MEYPLIGENLSGERGYQMKTRLLYTAYSLMVVGALVAAAAAPFAK